MGVGRRYGKRGGRTGEHIATSTNAWTSVETGGMEAGRNTTHPRTRGHWAKLGRAKCKETMMQHVHERVDVGRGCGGSVQLSTSRVQSLWIGLQAYKAADEGTKTCALNKPEGGRCPETL